MPPPVRDPKALSDWMELDYFQRPRRLRRFRRLISWTVLGLTVLLLAFTFWPGRPTLYQAGPLANAHRMFNQDCRQCHTESFATAKRLWPSHAHASSVPNQACIQCHDGPSHHPQQVSDPSCAGCHREHRGRAVLAAVPNGYCTDCHADLRRKDGQPTAVQNVRDFAVHHPEFALCRTESPMDPSRLHFNHRVHLKEERLPDAAGQKVQLNCASCHQPDADRRYMQPVNYEQHCAQCHPLSVQLTGRNQTPQVQQAAEQFRRQPAPHQRPVEVRAVLRDRLTRLVQAHPALLTDSAAPPERVFPGNPSRPAPAAASEWNWVEQQLQQTERMLFNGAGGCAFCHVKMPPASATTGSAALPEFEPTNIPRRWFPHSRFNHDSHRLLRCTECHAAAESEKTSDVLMPRIESCRQCHNPKVGVRSDCVDCHTYHDRSQKSTWTGTRTIQECLHPGPH